MCPLDKGTLGPGGSAGLCPPGPSGVTQGDWEGGALGRQKNYCSCTFLSNSHNSQVSERVSQPTAQGPSL